MKRFLIFGLLVAVACQSTPECLNQAERIRAELLNPDSKEVLVISHRGDWRNFPENSIPAIESVINMGADIVEIDLKMTRDSQLVVIHDRTVSRTMNIPLGKNGYESDVVKELTLAQLKALTLRRAQAIATDSLRIPTLEEALAVCKDRILVNLDGGIKYVDLVMPIAIKLGVEDQIILKGGYSVASVDSIFSKYENRPLYFPICSGTDLSSIKDFINAGNEDSLKKVAAFELCFNKNNTTDDYLPATELIHNAGARVWMNTIASGWSGYGNDDDAAFLSKDPDSVYGPVIMSGINMIQTDRPGFLLEYLRKKGLHK